MPDQPLGGADELDAAIDELYQAPLDGFTAARNALAAARRKAGDRAGADSVKALAKPSVTTWAVNQVWWRNRAAMERLFAAGERQRAEHRAFAEKGASDVRAAAIERQQAVDAVVELAVNALGGAGSVTPDVRHRLAGTVEALASGGVPADIRAGRLTRDLQPSGLEAFGALAGLVTSAPEAMPRPRPALVPATADSKAARRSASARAAATAELEARTRATRVNEASARLAALEAALDRATREAAERAAAERTAREDLEAATVRVADLDAQLAQARDRERATRRAMSAATKDASEAEMMRARTARDVANARTLLDELERG